jgi:rRNA maturation RNase YbeY
MRNWLSVLRDASPGPIALQNAMGAPPHVLLGDVVISLDTAARQAATDRQPIDQAVVRLLIHGILHLCGYDHERAREARRMRAKERAIFRLLRPIPKLVKR